MAEIFDNLYRYFQFPVVRYAVIVAVLVSLCASMLGVILVLKRFSFIGDGLSHVAFGAMAIAAVTGLTNNMFIVMPITVICAVLILCTGQNAKIKGDASIALISVSSLALGYLLYNVFSTPSNVSGDVCSTLFGASSILTLKQSDMWLSIIMSVIVIGLFVFFYNKIFSVTFDENFACATGTSAKLYNLIVAVITAVIIVLAMNLVGSLLISALIIFPALSAMSVFNTFKSVTICAVINSVLCTGVGMIISILAETPVGATIVAVDAVVFILYTVVGLFTCRRK